MLVTQESQVSASSAMTCASFQKVVREAIGKSCLLSEVGIANNLHLKRVRKKEPESSKKDNQLILDSARPVGNC